MKYQMKRIMLLATGGTIASKPSENGALAPAISADEILEFVPELKDICHIEALELYDLDSTDMGPEQWIGIASAIRDNYDKFDGFVITHGTDTMAYTASALSYMIQHSRKPVILTGSQKSIYKRDTDARRNLIQAFTYAASDLAFGIQIVFDSKVILGTRARKVRSKSFNAFSSIDYPETAVFRDERLITFLKPEDDGEKVCFSLKLDNRVFVLRLVPGISLDICSLLYPSYKAVVIEGFGVGGLPGGEEGKLLNSLRTWLSSGRLAVFSTQVWHEGSDLSVYEVGRIARELPGVMEARDMTPEAIVTKLMWVLGMTEDAHEARHLFETPIMHDIL